VKSNLRYLANMIGALVLTLALAPPSVGQQPSTVIPTLVNFTGTLTDGNGKPLNGIVGVTFYLYKDQQGGSPLWIETQNVQPDKYGHFSVMLGSTTSQGLPANLFISGEARWLGAQAEGQEEQPRVMLLSVPYAMKAGDAQTVGGLPPSAFVLAAPVSGDSANASVSSNDSPTPNLAGSGTTDFIPLWTNSTTLGNSVLFQSGSGTTAKIGVGTATPASSLDVNGGGTIRGLLALPATGTATSAGGKISQPFDLTASAFNSGTNSAVNQTFQWQAEPVNNDTSNASGSLSLLFAQGTNKPAETGLHLASNGQIVFAKGQTFPGTGTITGVNTAGGSGLTGGGTSGTLNLALTNTCTAKQILQWNGSAWACAAAGTGTVTSVASGTGLTGGPITGSGTLSIDATAVPLLASVNTFSQTQIVNAVNPFAGVLQATSPYQAMTGTMTSNDSFTAAVLGNATATGTGNTIGVQGTSSTTGGYGVFGFNNGGGTGVYGQASAASAAPIGVFGQNGSLSTTGSTCPGPDLGVCVTEAGVWGDGSAALASGGGPVGVFGQNGSLSTTGSTCPGPDLGICVTEAGVWGDGGTSQIASTAGIVGTVDDGVAGLFVNNSPSGFYTVAIEGVNSNTWPFVTYASTGNSCIIDQGAHFSCNGALNAVVSVDDGKGKVALAAIESPKNWFEDAGSSELVNGAAVVSIDPEFAQTANTAREYQVFLTPYGDCKGLYVTNRTANSFEVHELGGGTASLSFGYRIMALRKDYENIRFADHTHDLDRLQLLRKHRETTRQQTQSQLVRGSAVR
jgi:hypothetical protein